MGRAGHMGGLARLRATGLAVGLAGVLLALVPRTAPSADAAGAALKVRQPAVAGVFYPADPDELRGTIGELLRRAEPPVAEELGEATPAGLVVPHAGLTYSGLTAAHAYKLLEGRERPSSVVLIGPSHRVAMRGKVSVAPFTHYRTPLGEVPVDIEARDKLLENPWCVSEELAHSAEHCLEVQLPFLQVLWDKPPEILPIVTGRLGKDGVERLATALREIRDRDTLIVASTDFTHYGTRFGFAPFGRAGGRELGARIKELDRGAIEHLRDCDAKGFLDYCARTQATICGRDAVAALLMSLCEPDGIQSVALDYASSGDRTGDFAHSVSYHAHAFYRAEKHAPAQ